MPSLHRTSSVFPKTAHHSQVCSPNTQHVLSIVLSLVQCIPYTSSCISDAYLARWCVILQDLARSCKIALGKTQQIQYISSLRSQTIEIGNYIIFPRCRRKLITALNGAVQSFVSFLRHRISLSMFSKFPLRWSTWGVV